MTHYKEVDGYYGSGKNESIIFVCRRANNCWYAVKGSMMVNKTMSNIKDGVNVEELEDVECFTWSREINTLNQFIKAIES